MDDFFSQEQVDDSVVNAEDNQKLKKGRLDIRYHRTVSTVTSADKALDYKVKVWPTLDENDAEGPLNALGVRIEDYQSRKKAQIKEFEQFQSKKRQELFLEISNMAEEEMELVEAERQKPAFTVEELEQIRNEAFDEGKNQGLEEGREKGHEEGLQSGYSEGVEKGVAEGLEKGYQDGYRQGQEEGFTKGHSEGLESGQSVVLEQVERFRYLADSLANPLRELDRDVTDEICYIISRLAKVIIRKEINNNEPFLRNTLDKALSILPNSKKGASIYLNPEDAALVRSALGSEYINEQHWELNDDESLEIGDIRVCNSASTVEWRVNDRIDSLLDEFLSSVYPNVNSALKESIEGCPEYDEIPKKKIAKRTLTDIKDSIEHSVNPEDHQQMQDAESEGGEISDESVSENEVSDAPQEDAQQVLMDEPQNRELSAIEELESQVSEPMSDEDAASILSKSATGEI